MDVASRNLSAVARKLRRDATEAEKLLWKHLRSRQLDGAKFLRQFVIEDYVADFACRKAKLLIEVDGGQHGDDVDRKRTEVIEAAGYRVVRFWNHDVLSNVEGVMAVIRGELALARGY